MRLPSRSSGSSVVVGAATKKGMSWKAAATASEKVPTLLAASPLAATRSAPTTTASTRPDAISAAAAESHSRVAGSPSWASSYAVSRAPWL
jgi:hypothetical protein